ncbi:glycosyltransferase [Luteimonas sp. RD2P54]|uniref:Glycosyltransferase n=1 Tax=Luteimonas endophytica TaxID=3042023 RepID=A0ABT6JDA8_9GAMM|nr:glycosyltransferase [Luteimonas endophytica]MDH5824789.1 glycosyltransferase [Luteimonas endophytica]
MASASTAASVAPFAGAPRLSVVVPAHDEARRIGATLAALHAAAAAAGVPYEIVVADDASTDATAAIAAAGGARVLHVAHRHIAATRNAGARAAAGDWLLFVDADTRVDAAVLRAALAALAGGAAGGGCAVRLDGRQPLYVRALVSLSVLGFRLARIAPGCFLFCTRAAFEAAGGFDERWYAGEDVAISRALARAGRFVVLREHVLTSGRKLRTHSPLQQLALLWRLALRGRGMLRSRQGLELWYGERREHPDEHPADGRAPAAAEARRPPDPP